MLPAIEVILINWKRPENVERIIRALKSQTIPCTITVCDCHNNPEFGLSDEAIGLIDRVFKWDHNLGPFSRYVPLASYDHNYTLFIDDDILPGKRCLEAFLQAAFDKPDFGVLGQMGRILGNDGAYNVSSIKRGSDFVEVDFVIRSYFVKTRYLHNLIKFRWQIGHFEEIQLQDDLLMCASLKYYEKLRCFLIPENDDPETLVNKVELDAGYAFSSTSDHYKNRQNFVDRIMYHGWKPIYDFERYTATQKHNSGSVYPRVSVCIVLSDLSADLLNIVNPVYHWDCCHEILMINGTSLDEPIPSQALPDPHNKVKYIMGRYSNAVELRNHCAKEVTGTHLLILDSYEFYSKTDLRVLKEDIINNPDVDLFKFDFSHDPNQRNYFYCWHGFNSQIMGEYWDVPQYRIFKWTQGTRFNDTGNEPVRPNGRTLTHPSAFIKTFTTRARCVNTRFVSKIGFNAQNVFFEKMEIENTNEKIARVRQMYIDCMRAFKSWSLNMPLPPNAQIFPLPSELTEAILDPHKSRGLPID